MKNFFLLLFLALSEAIAAQAQPVENIILVTWDGFRWQELYGGADKKWMTEKYVKDINTLQQQFNGRNAEERRKKLMPFFWSTLVKQGTLIGNRWKGSKMRVANLYKISYPGYSEMFTGYVDARVNSNNFHDNPNTNIFDFVSSQPEFKDKIAAFATWDAFPRIINSSRNKVPVFVNFKKQNNTVSAATVSAVSFTNWQTTCPPLNPWAETDSMTYHFAKEYLHRKHPRFTFIGFDETDHYAHEGQYDAYLNTAHMLDGFIKDLWNFIQNDSVYKNKTTLIITCDHGRGNKQPGMWRHHGFLPKNSYQTWLVALGPNVPNLGEVAKGEKYFQKQVAQTIARLMGKNYSDTTHPVAPAIDILVK